MTDKLTSDEVFDILKGTMPMALVSYLLRAEQPLSRGALEMVQAVREQAKEASAEEERAKIVAWLREQGEYGSEHAQAWGETFATYIEAKDHLK